MNDKNILAIESSCDESAASVLSFNEDTALIKSNTVFSQLQHKDSGGVIPEIAAREHERQMQFVVENALKTSGIKLNEIDYFAATCGPGLIGGLIVGVTFTKTLSIIYNKPFIAVNHLAGHALAPRILDKNIGYEYNKCNRNDRDSEILFPYMLLLISGGHCQILIVYSPTKYQNIGETIDDALGETFDKVAKMLNLPYPGGKHIERYAIKGNEEKFNFPRPMMFSKDCKMSFSGLKTALRKEIQKNFSQEKEKDTYISNISASFQKACGDVLIKKIHNGIHYCKENKIELTQVVLSGGVSANNYLYNRIKVNIEKNFKIEVIAPIQHLCTDNGGMIAWAAYEMIKFGYNNDDIDFTPRPKWNLDEFLY